MNQGTIAIKGKKRDVEDPMLPDDLGVLYWVGIKGHERHFLR